jgi:hypothetical protein
VKYMAAGVLLVLLLLAADQVTHRTALDRITEQTDANIGAAADALAPEALRRTCGDGRLTESGRLARAIFAVETAATSRSERVVEDVAARVLPYLGLPVPALSLGPGQIRYSTLTTALPDLQSSLADANATSLLDYCKALSIAERIIALHLKVPEANSLLSRDDILRIAKEWNGQRGTHDQIGLLAGLRYQELVYQTMIAIRFKSISPEIQARASVR